MKQISTFLLVLASLFAANTAANAQTTCDGVRYLRKTFTVNTAPTTVLYGRNTPLGSSTIKDLKMDIYQPDGDVATNRPVLIFAFGGSFISGTRTDASVVQVCKAYAARGYVTCAIDYRIYAGSLFPLPDSLKFAQLVVKAVADVKAATRYLRKSAANGNPYRINPDVIVAGGISAGGIATMHAAYLRETADAPPFIQTYLTSNGGIHGNTDDPAGSAMMYSDSIMGLVNYFGGLYRTNMLDPGEPPVVSIHGTADNVVPYNFGYANVFNTNIITINGSGRNHPWASQMGVANQLISVPGGGHGDFLTNATWTDSMDVTSTRFIYNNVLCKVATENAAAADATFTIQPNPSNTAFTLQLSEVSEAYTVQLTDLTGRMVYQSAALRDANHSVPTADLPNGTYVATVRFRNSTLRPIANKVVVLH
jgi:para-nitrobenzyl esterase